MSHLGWRLGAVAVFGAAVACSDSTGPGAGARTIGLLVTTPRGAAGVAGFAPPESVVVGGHTMVLDKVELVIKEIELKRVASTTTCGSDEDTAPEASGGGDDHGDHHGKEHGNGQGHDEDCFDFQTGPLLVDVPLGGGPKRVVAVAVDTGSYAQVEFKIHKVRGSDTAFAAAHPDLNGLSVRVTGKYDGKAFTFTSDVSAKQENDLVPPLVVNTNTATNLTLEVEVASWFVAGGIGLVDPASAAAGKPNENLVRQNIRRSFHVFEDDDHDGRRDR